MAANNNIRRLERKPRSKRLPAAPPGLHAGTVELEARGAFKTRLATGELVTATLAANVAPALATEALRERRTVLVVVTPAGATILGALQTQPSQSFGALRLRADTVELEGEGGIVLRAGKTKLTISPDGSIHLVGDAMTMRLARALRVLAANVELP